MNAFHLSLDIPDSEQADDNNPLLPEQHIEAAKALQSKRPIRFTPGTAAWSLMLCLYVCSKKYDGEMMKSEILNNVEALAKVTRITPFAILWLFQCSW